MYSSCLFRSYYSGKGFARKNCLIFLPLPPFPLVIRGKDTSWGQEVGLDTEILNNKRHCMGEWVILNFQVALKGDSCLFPSQS